MTMKSKIATPLIAAAALFAVPAQAADDPMLVEGHQTRAMNQERVSFADLDLREGSARTALRRRVRIAADGICVQLADRVAWASTADIWNCADTAYSDATPQVRAAIAATKSGRRVAMAITIAAPARTR